MTKVTVTIQVDGSTYNPTLANGVFSQVVPLSANGLHLLTVQATNEAGGQSAVVTHRVINATPTGNMSINGPPSISDALLALEVGVGLMPMQDSYLVYGDVGPLVKNAAGKLVSAPDWKINISDAIVILEIIVGSVTLSQ
jgi:hypothetical protein